MKILHLGIICLATCLWSLALHGQERANYKAADQFLPSNAGSLIYSKEMKPSYLPGTDRFWFSYKTSQGTSYYLVDPRKKKMEPLFDNERMATQIAELTGKACDTVNLNINPIFEEGKEGEFTFWANQKQLRYDMKTRTCTEIPRQKPGNRPAKPYNPTAMMYSVSSDRAYVAFSKRHNVWLRRSDEPDSLARPLTTDGVKEFSYSDNEMDDNDRIFTTKARWLKGTHRLFAIRVDNRGIGTLPVVSSSFGRPRLVTSIGGDKYIMPGDKRVPQYELSLLDAETGEVRKVDIAKWQDQELKLLHVSADSRYLYLQRTRRTRDELDICRVDTETGEVTVILNEVCKPYFNDRNQSIAFINDDTEFIWWSERSGWGHYYLYSADGQLKSPVTAGEWMAEKIVRIDTARREVYVIGHGREEGMNPYYACLYKATLDGDGAVKLLTPEDANHHVEFSPSGDYFTDNFSRVDMAPRSVLRDKNGKLVRALAEADLSTLLATGWRMPERFTVKTADGKTDLYGVMWKPIDFDSTRKYPVISYVYPGPQMETGGTPPLHRPRPGGHIRPLRRRIHVGDGDLRLPRVLQGGGRLLRQPRQQHLQPGVGRDLPRRHPDRQGSRHRVHLQNPDDGRTGAQAARPPAGHHRRSGHRKVGCGRQSSRGAHGQTKALLLRVEECGAARRLLGKALGNLQKERRLESFSRHRLGVQAESMEAEASSPLTAFLNS